MSRIRRTTAGLLMLAASTFACARAEEAGDAAGVGSVQQGTAEQVGALQDEQLAECSGLAASRLHPGVWWAHNDSGDGPRLFALDGKGRALGRWQLQGVKARDWEDLASFEMTGQAWLLVGDVGDNQSKQSHVTLHLVREPALGQATRGEAEPTPVELSVKVRFEDGPRDCEGVAVDGATRRVYLVSKVVPGRDRTSWTHVYELTLPTEPVERVVTAKRIAQIVMPPVTAMDLSADGLRLAMLTYGLVYEWRRTADQAWSEVLKQGPRVVTQGIPGQAEALGYSADGLSIWVTTEGRRAPVLRVRLKE